MAAAVTHEHTIEQIIQAKNGDKQAENRLVEENTGLIWSIVRKFANRGHELDDLFQIGAIGLLKAIHKFDISYEVRFSTYAVPMILGEIKRFLRDDGLIKVSRSLKVLAGKAKSAREELAAAYGRAPTIRELADALAVEPEELAAALEATQQHESLYTPYSENEKILLIDKLSGGHSSETETLNRIALREMLSSLPERERRILVLRYFNDQTQAQVAKQLGISQVQVSRIEKKLLALLRERFAEK